MKIFLTDQSKQFEKYLNELKQTDVIQYSKSNLKEKTTSISIDTNKALQDLNLDFFWNYNIFPSSILTFLTEWNLRNRKMQIGDTIVQQAFLPPIKIVSQKIIFGVRINRIINEEHKKGFSYETLCGHVEMGESTFTIEKINNNKTFFKIHTFSRPGSILTKLIGPIFSIPYQTFCTNRGLKNVKKQIEANN